MICIDIIYTVVAVEGVLPEEDTGGGCAVLLQ